MLTAKEVIDALSDLDPEIPVMVPSVVGLEGSTKVKLRQVCFRGSFSEPGQWMEKEDSSPAAVARGAITVVVIE